MTTKVQLQKKKKSGYDPQGALQQDELISSKLQSYINADRRESVLRDPRGRPF
jgi:hypothetical protein